MGSGVTISGEAIEDASVEVVMLSFSKVAKEVK